LRSFLAAIGAVVKYDLKQERVRAAFAIL
jgi:hypothetical protein